MNRSFVLTGEGWNMLRDSNARLAAFILERMMLNGDHPPPMKRSRV